MYALPCSSRNWLDDYKDLKMKCTTMDYSNTWLVSDSCRALTADTRQMCFHFNTVYLHVIYFKVFGLLFGVCDSSVGRLDWVHWTRTVNCPKPQHLACKTIKKGFIRIINLMNLMTSGSNANAYYFTGSDFLFQARDLCAVTWALFSVTLTKLKTNY